MNGLFQMTERTWPDMGDELLEDFFADWLADYEAEIDCLEPGELRGLHVRR